MPACNVMMMMMMFPKDGSFGSPMLSQKLNMKSIVKNHTYHWLQRCPHKKHGKMISDRPTQEAITDRKRQAPHPTLLFFDGGKNWQGGSLHKPCLEEHCNLKNEHWEAAAGEGRNKQGADQLVTHYGVAVPQTWGVITAATVSHLRTKCPESSLM